MRTRLSTLSACVGVLAAGAYALLIRGALTLDLGVGRRVRPLGPIVLTIAAPREMVFDVVAGPYLGRTPRAMRAELRVWERASDMPPAAHFRRTGRRSTTAGLTRRCERLERVS